MSTALCFLPPPGRSFPRAPPCEACPLGGDCLSSTTGPHRRPQSFTTRACGQPTQTSSLSGIVGARNGGPRIFRRNPQLPSLPLISAFRDCHSSPRVRASNSIPPPPATPSLGSLFFSFFFLRTIPQTLPFPSLIIYKTTCNSRSFGTAARLALVEEAVARSMLIQKKKT